MVVVGNADKLNKEYLTRLKLGLSQLSSWFRYCMEDVDDLGSPNRRDSPRSLRNWKAAAGVGRLCHW